MHVRDQTTEQWHVLHGGIYVHLCCELQQRHYVGWHWNVLRVYLYVYSNAQGCEPKTENRLRRSFYFSVFPTEKRLLKGGFSVAKKKKKRKNDFCFWSFFSPVPHANNAYIFIYIYCMEIRYVWTHRHAATSTHSTQQSSTAPVNSVGLEFSIEIVCMGISIASTSYPPTYIPGGTWFRTFFM